MAGAVLVGEGEHGKGIEKYSVVGVGLLEVMLAKGGVSSSIICM